MEHRMNNIKSRIVNLTDKLCHRTFYNLFIYLIRERRDGEGLIQWTPDRVVHWGSKPGLSTQLYEWVLTNQMQGWGVSQW